MSRDHAIILIVDDLIYSNVLARAFGRRGYMVNVVPDFSKLEAVLSRATPSYAVVDFTGNCSLGLRCVAALRKANATTAVVMLTGYASQQVVAEAVSLGACCCLPTPCDIDDIETALVGVKTGSLWSSLALNVSG